MVRNTPKNAEPTAKAKLPPFVRGLLCIGTVLLVCFVVSIMLEVWYCKSAPNAAIKLAACLVLDAFAFLLPGVVATECTMKCVIGARSFEASRCSTVPLPYMSMT